MIGKKKTKEFIEGVCKGLLELGAKKINEDENFVALELETIVGRLVINIPMRQMVIFSVFSKFDNVELAKQKFDCNPFSGKYNVHIGLVPKMTTEKYIELALIAFECTQPNECSTTKPL